MTREEIEELKGLAASMGLYDDKKPCKRAVILGKAIKALEQEPCEDATLKDIFCMGCEYKEQEPCDAISRQAAIDLANELKDDLPDDDHLSDMVMSHNEGVLEYQTKLSLLPPVTPQPKTGHWINKSRRSGCGILFVESECTCCEKKTPFNCDEFLYRYCPNCGAKMIELQESEDKK